MEFHELANCFPLMEGREFDELVEDVRARGLKQPIVRYEGKILDGRNRWRACRACGAAPMFQDYTGDEPAQYVASLNLVRRHLTDQQRTIAAAKLSNLSSGRPPLQPKGEKTLHKRKVSQSEAAEMLKVDHSQVSRARTVLHEGKPEVVQAMESGSMTISAAYKATRPPVEAETRTDAQVGAEIAKTYGDGEWHHVNQTCREIDASRAQVESVIDKWSRDGRRNRVETRQLGRSVQFRIIPKGRTVYSTEIQEKLTPIVNQLREEGKKPSVMMSSHQVLYLAGLLEKYVKEWASCSSDSGQADE